MKMTIIASAMFAVCASFASANVTYNIDLSSATALNTTGYALVVAGSDSSQYGVSDEAETALTSAVTVEGYSTSVNTLNPIDFDGQFSGGDVTVDTVDVDPIYGGIDYPTLIDEVKIEFYGFTSGQDAWDDVSGQNQDHTDAGWEIDDRGSLTGPLIRNDMVRLTREYDHLEAAVLAFQTDHSYLGWVDEQQREQDVATRILKLNIEIDNLRGLVAAIKGHRDSQ